jgi:drug/metabolite transporter (DMT)-like permease
MVLASVAMQLAAAWLLKHAPAPASDTVPQVAVVLALVLALNVFRFLVWGELHRRYPVSLAYPLSALVFPCVVVMAWWLGEAIGWLQVAGSLVVMAGVSLMLVDDDAGDPA